MMLLTLDLHHALRANDIAHRAALRDEQPELDPFPVVKIFNPFGAATWLATELDEDGDILFGLADLGFGCPELGAFRLSEMEAIRLPGGLGLERDLYFTARFPLSVYAEAARVAGSIIESMPLLSTIARTRGLLALHDPELPPNGG